MAPMATEVDRNAEPEPEGSAPTPSSMPLRDGQPQAETEDVELPTVQFDADSDPILPAAADVPVPEDNDVLTLQSKAKEGRGAKELNPRTFDVAERKAFDVSDGKELNAWYENKGGLRGVDGARNDEDRSQQP